MEWFIINDWNTAANWSTNSVPTSSDDVIIPNVTNDPIITVHLTFVKI